MSLVKIKPNYHTTMKICFTTLKNTSKLVQHTPLRVVFSTLFSVFGNVIRHCLSFDTSLQAQATHLKYHMHHHLEPSLPRIFACDVSRGQVEHVGSSLRTDTMH